MKTGIFGGTFNPIHFGHLIIAETIRESFGLDKVLFIPSGTPPHKKYTELTGAEHRFSMVERAVRSNPYFEVSRLELDRPGYTYTIDTLADLKGQYGSDTSLYFIIGADVINELTTWKEHKKVFGLCSFLAVNRPGYDVLSTVRDMERLTLQYGADIKLLEAPLMDISSTDIRNRLKTGRSIRYLVPDRVEEYILENKLWQE